VKKNVCNTKKHHLQEDTPKVLVLRKRMITKSQISGVSKLLKKTKEIEKKRSRW